MTEYYMESVEALHALEPLMKTMEKEGVWERLVRKPCPKAMGGRTNILHVYRKN